MIAEAYAYADGEGVIPVEIRKLNYIDRFGIDAVYGRQLNYQELRRLEIAEAVVKGYISRKNSPDWTKWARENKKINALLEMGLRLTNG